MRLQNKHCENIMPKMLLSMDEMSSIIGSFWRTNNINDTPAEHRRCCWTNCCAQCCSIQLFSKQSAATITYADNHSNWLEREQMDELIVMGQYRCPARWHSQPADDDSIKNLVILCEKMLNDAFQNSNLAYRHLLLIDAAIKYTIGTTRHKLAILFKEMPLAIASKLSTGNNQKEELKDECEIEGNMRNPIFTFELLEKYPSNQIEMQYQEAGLFEEIKGGRLQLLDGHYMPRIGLHCPPDLDAQEAEELIRDALELGCRLFDLTFFYYNREEISAAIKKYLPWHELNRSQIFIAVKINIMRPEGMGNFANNTKGKLFTTVADYIAHCIQCCIREFCYIDLCMIHYPKDFHAPNSDENNKADRINAYAKMVEFKGYVRSIGVSNFESVHIDELLLNGMPCPCVNQCEMHPFLQRPDLVKYCGEKKMILQAHSIFAYRTSWLPSKEHEKLQQILNACCCGLSQSITVLAFILNISPTTIGIVPMVRPCLDAPQEDVWHRRRCMLHNVLCSGNHQLDAKIISGLKQLDLGKQQGSFTKCRQWDVL